ncbi:glycosyl transferase [Bacillus sp. MUM 116]|uniref:glycosyltransferase family 39 protein n=1 Tax=Bacillus sp. MUM 116 TaxID=1678002 RepID=UPI0008F5F7EC|nr:glycosyltransferase family 39 protein [Bacillus sp. MUM 116]OIK10381.1 glycosyl transferase [Bacillus sp. MUM 116]
MKKLQRVDFLLIGILLLSFLLNFYNLKNAGSNTYYTAAVKSMMQNFHAFFYGSFDSQGFITVDKPPVALWIQTLSAKIFGLSDFSVLLPEALAGVVSVFIMYILVKPKFGRVAGLISSLVLACSPIFVAVVRTNNVDSILIVTLLAATWALVKSIEKQKVGWLILSVILVGIGFNIKMLQAYMVLPAFYLFYWIAVKTNWKKRLMHLLAATMVLAAVSLSWAIVVDSVPASKRPYIGSSQTNSVLELALGYNGVSRLTGMNNKSPRGSAVNEKKYPTQQQGITSNQGQTSSNQKQGNQSSSGNDGASNFPGMFGNDTYPPHFQSGRMGGPGNGSSSMFGTGTPSPLRLFSTELSGQISWFLPFVFFAAIGIFAESRKNKRFDLSSKFSTFWISWLIPMMIFFSIAKFFHQYYLSMMGPAIAALVGIGWTVLWNLFKNKEGWESWLLPCSVVANFLFEALILYQNSQASMMILGTLIAGVVSLIIFIQLRRGESFTLKLPMAAVLALLVIPLYWTGITINKTGNSMTPIAGPNSSFGRMGGGQFARNMGGYGGMHPGNSYGEDASFITKQDSTSVPANAQFHTRQGRGGRPENEVNTSLLSYLKKHYDGEKYFFATDSTQSAAPYILKTDYAVMAMGGFSGSDPALTPAKLAKMAKAGEVKFFLISGRDRMGGDQSQSVTKWIQENCKEVPSREWQGNTSTNMFGGRMGGETLYVYNG